MKETEVACALYPADRFYVRDVEGEIFVGIVYEDPEAHLDVMLTPVKARKIRDALTAILKRAPKKKKARR